MIDPRPYRALALAALPLTLALSACTNAEDVDGDGIAEVDGDALPAIEPPDGQVWTEVVTVSPAGGYVLGNPEAPIKLVEYASLTCPACASFAATGAPELKSEYVASGRVSYELRNQIHNAPDLVLARLVRCGQDASFHPLSDRVWADLDELLTAAQQPQVQQAMTLPPEQRFVALAERAGFLDFFARNGLSRDQARACLSDPASLEAIARASTEQSEELGVQSTPTFLLNGRVLDERGWPELEALLQRAGAR